MPEVNDFQRKVLYVTVACAGLVFLCVEIAGSRILAPSFGNSIFVWGSLIAQFMAAYALGARLGGWLADRHPSAGWLMAILIISGVLTGTLIPLMGTAICRQLAGVVSNEAIGPLVSAMVLFFIPSLLMAMAPPYAIKLLTTSLSKLGTVAGKVSSVNTLGSIVGALLTAFVLIRFFRVSVIFHSIGAALVLVGVISWILAPRGASAQPAAEAK